MTRLPQVTGERVVRALGRAGFKVVRQRGSHAVLRHASDPARRCTVPLHGGDAIKPGTLHAILRGAGIELDAFLALL